MEVPERPRRVVGLSADFNTSEGFEASAEIRYLPRTEQLTTALRLDDDGFRVRLLELWKLPVLLTGVTSTRTSFASPGSGSFAQLAASAVWSGLLGSRVLSPSRSPRFNKRLTSRARSLEET
jgi:hypothetical protein